MVMSTPYDLVEIKMINSSNKMETIHARPIEWNEQPWTGDGRNRSGEFIKPTKFMVTCPKCVQRVDFIMDDISVDHIVICNVCDPFAAQMQRQRNIEAKTQPGTKVEPLTVPQPTPGKMVRAPGATSLREPPPPVRKAKVMPTHPKAGGLTPETLQEFAEVLTGKAKTKTRPGPQSKPKPQPQPQPQPFKDHEAAADGFHFDHERAEKNIEQLREKEIVVLNTEKKLRDPLTEGYDTSNLDIQT